MRRRLSLSEVLNSVRLRPKMYLPEVRATLLDAFIVGFLMASVDVKDGDLYASFRHWLGQSKVKNRHQSIGVELMELAGSDAAAFDEFIRLLDEFLPTYSGGRPPLPEGLKIDDEDD